MLFSSVIPRARLPGCQCRAQAEGPDIFSQQVRWNAQTLGYTGLDWALNGTNKEAPNHIEIMRTPELVLGTTKGVIMPKGPGLPSFLAFLLIETILSKIKNRKVMSCLFSIWNYARNKGHALREPLSQGLKMIYRAKRGKAEFALRTLTFRLTITMEPAPNIC